MANFLKFDLSSVTGTANEIAENISALLNGDVSLAKALITHYKGKMAAELVILGKEYPEYVGVVNGLEGLWLSNCTVDMRRAGHSEWVQKKVMDALFIDD